MRKVIFNTSPKSEEKLTEYDKAFIDMIVHGQGFMEDGKHIPISDIYKKPEKAKE